MGSDSLAHPAITDETKTTKNNKTDLRLVGLRLLTLHTLLEIRSSPALPFVQAIRRPVSPRRSTPSPRPRVPEAAASLRAKDVRPRQTPDARGDAHEHGEREARGGHNKHGAVEIAHIEAGVLDCRWGVWLDWNENGTLDMVCMATNGVYAYEAR